MIQQAFLKTVITTSSPGSSGLLWWWLATSFSWTSSSQSWASPMRTACNRVNHSSIRLRLSWSASTSPSWATNRNWLTRRPGSLTISSCASLSRRGGTLRAATRRMSGRGCSERSRRGSKSRLMHWRWNRRKSMCQWKARLISNIKR